MYIKNVCFISAGKSISTTAASPVICQCNDGNHYYTKFYEGIEGPRELVNEFVGFELAKLLKLPIPSAALVELDCDFDVPIGNEIRHISSSHKYAFGSQGIAHVFALINENFIDGCKNKNDLLPIILFDHIIGNTDRAYNTGNILYRYHDKIIFIIDNGRIFDVGSLWNSVTCKQRINDEINLEDINEKSIYGKIINHIDLSIYVEDCRNRFSSVTYKNICDIFENIPLEWDCSMEDRESGAEFIWKRIQQYEIIMDKILSMKR